MEDAQVGRLFLVLRGGQLFLQYVETFLEVRPSVFLQLVVNFSGTSPEDQRRLFPFRFRTIRLVYDQRVHDVETIVQDSMTRDLLYSGAGYLAILVYFLHHLQKGTKLFSIHILKYL